MMYDNLQRVLKELQPHKGRSRSDMMSSYVQDRLSASLESYYSEIKDSYNQIAYSENKCLKASRRLAND